MRHIIMKLPNLVRVHSYFAQRNIWVLNNTNNIITKDEPGRTPGVFKL